MNNKALIYLAFFLVPLVTNCAPVQQYSTLAQPLGTSLVAGVGDDILTISKEKNLPNAFGASDIFGRKTPTGMISVQYLGIRKGKAIFKRQLINIETGATTMNSSPTIISNEQTTTHSGMVGSVAYHGTSTTSAAPTVIPAYNSPAQFYGQNSLEITIDLKNAEKMMVVDGRTIKIEQADNTKITYIITE